MPRLHSLATALAILSAFANSMTVTSGASPGPVDELFTGWQADSDEGTVRMHVDRTDFFAGSESLRLETVGGPAKGKAMRSLDVQPGDRVRISAQVKAQGQLDYAAFVVLAIGAKDGWMPIGSLTTNNTWMAIEGTVSIPEGTRQTLLMLYLTGEGSAWVDEVAINQPGPSVQTRLANPEIMTDFETPFTFAYGDFQEAVEVEGSQARIRAKRGRGGAGINFPVTRDLSSQADHSPALVMMVEPGNRAKSLRLAITDAQDHKVEFTYDLTPLKPGQPATVLPEHGLSLQSLIDDPQAIDPAKIVQLQIVGPWKDDSVRVTLDRIELVEPTAAILADRARYRDELLRRRRRQRRQAEEAELARQRLLTDGNEHPQDGPEVIRVSAAAPDVIALEIQAGRTELAQPIAYRKQPGDQRKEKEEKGRLLQVQDGRIVRGPKGVEILRDVDGDGRGESIGVLNEANNTLWSERLVGRALDDRVILEPQAYRITSSDPSDGVPREPRSVSRKSVPFDLALPGKGQPVRHRVYLQLARPLRERATYTISLTGLNTRQSEVSFRHESSKVRSESIHVSQIGYRPDDPLKRAYLSLWLGTGGSYRFDVESFHLIEEPQGRIVFTGPIERAFPADRTERLNPAKNHVGTDVSYLDFAEFDRPGRYRILVPGLGVSDVITIDETTWKDAFAISMLGFLHHRSGIALGPPLTDYVRPRPMHPDDGVTVYRTDVTIWDGEAEAIREDLERQVGPDLDTSQLRVHRSAWGGYMDAGDWDRRSQHLMATYLHLELLELFPEAVTETQLRLPREESTNRLPDTLDEALWNLAFFRRLQESDGAVGGGVESTAHPKDGQCSWQEQLLLGAIAPDPETTYRYAAVAAKAAGLLRLCQSEELARSYRASALEAWQWAEQNAEQEIRRAVARGAKRIKSAQDARRRTDRMRALAAVELYRLTAEPSYHDAFRACSAVARGGNVETEIDATFAYARLPEKLAEPKLKRAAIDALITLADQSVAFSQANAFNLAFSNRYLPMIGYVGYYAVPEMTIGPLLSRVHSLTGDPTYLAALIGACQYGAGANPHNMTMTTGLGPRSPIAPLHLDSRRSGQPAPAGITVYGQSDPSASTSFNDWVHTWFLRPFMVPDSRSWPAAEGFVDLGNWPASNEYTIHQTMGPTSYTWGYLAHRP